MRDRQKRRAIPPQTPAGAGVRAVWIYAGLAALVLSIYARTWNYSFVTWDDPQYVTGNPRLAAGLSWSSAWWALTTQDFYWHPLTWLSYLLDYQLFGLNPGPYHAVNVLLHAAAALALFAALRELTGAMWRSGLAAAVLAAHPLRVESVAWVSERKDVLSALFWALAMLAWARYARQPSMRRYLAVCALFAAGLMAKPMVVTLPLALLLLDAWPLGRWKGHAAARIREKLPLVAMSAAAGVITYVTQRDAGTLADLESLPLGMRASNALVSLVAYLGKTVWPVDLAALYPFLPVPGWKATAAGAVLALISVVVYRLAPRYPYLAMGWLWYLVTLAPVIGLVQAGGLAMADRFTYLPHIGLLVAAVWGIAEFAGRLRVSRAAVAIAAGLVILAFTVASVRQAAYWSDSVALWERTLQVTVANYRAHNNLGVELRARGRRAEAVAHFREALNIRGDFAEGHNNLGGALAETGNLAQAVEHYRQALRLNPEYPEAHNNLGVAYANQGQLEEAIREFQHSLRIHPDQADTHANLAVMYESQGDISRAMEHFSRALRLNPQHREARRSLEGLGRRANPAAPEAGNVDLGRNPVLP